MEPKETFIPITDWDKKYAYPSLGGMRYRYRFRKGMGYEKAFFKEGKRVFVRANEFWDRFEKRGERK